MEDTQELPKPRRVITQPPVEAPSGNVNITLDQFQMMMQMIVAESRKPVRDEMKESQKKRMQDSNRNSIRDKNAFLLDKFLSCSHMQRPGSILTDCSAVAWATQSDAKDRGTCQHCGTLFSPVREECLHQEIWEAYKHLIRIPTHPAGNVNYDFQHA